MQGSDLSGVMLGRETKGPDSAYLAIHGSYQGDDTPGAWRGIRTKTHVYARFKDKPWVLHDVEKDPYELKNLAGEPSAAALQKEMEAQLARKMKEVGDDWAFDWQGLPEDAGRLYKDRTFYSVREYEEWVGRSPGAGK
jgi:arylsulfatase A-like enzyme